MTDTKLQSTNGSEMEVAWTRARSEWEYPHVYVITISRPLAQKMQLNWSPAGAAHRASQAFDRPTLFATRLEAFLPQPTARKSSFFNSHLPSQLQFTSSHKTFISIHIFYLALVSFVIAHYRIQKAPPPAAIAPFRPSNFKKPNKKRPSFHPPSSRRQ